MSRSVCRLTLCTDCNGDFLSFASFCSMTMPVQTWKLPHLVHAGRSLPIDKVNQRPTFTAHDFVVFPYYFTSLFRSATVVSLITAAAVLTAGL